MDIEEILKALNANASQGRKASAIHRVISNDLRWHVEHGDSLVVLKSMPDACVDAIVTDPPAGIAFMGKGWDEFGRVNDRAIDPTKNNKGLLPSYGRGGTPEDRRKANRRARDAFIPWLTEVLEECYRVTKPGGRMLCWSIPRTMHWTGCAIEDAGWSIENTIAHLFGSGFPKAKTQLKPAREDWWLARKPAKNVLPLNIDECRVAFASAADEAESKGKNQHADLGSDSPITVNSYGDYGTSRPNYKAPGRWPSNVLLQHAPECQMAGAKSVWGDARGADLAKMFGGRRPGGFGDIGADSGHGGPNARVFDDADGRETVEDWRCVEGCPVAELDRQSGDRKGSPLEWKSNGQRNGVSLNAAHDGSMTTPAVFQGYGDSGGASRFFNTFGVDRDDIDTALFIYQAKASRADRNAGNAANTHPTVKSTPLMRHLVKLIAKPGDVVLDAFCGSGSTGRGAVLEGCRFIGIEREDTEAEPYVTIARRRIADATKTQ